MTVHPFAPRRAARSLNYRVEAKNSDRGAIYLYDMIGEDWLFGGVSATQFAKDLKALGSVKFVDLYINSEGGDVFSAKAMMAELLRHPAEITAHVDGLAASAASLLLMAGERRIAAAGSFVMIHNCHSVARGDAAEMRRVADLLDSVNDSVIDTYVERTNSARAKIVAMMNVETWMDAAAAKAAGFVDEIADPVKVAASVGNPALYRNLPAALRPNRGRASAAIAAMAGALR